MKIAICSVQEFNPMIGGIERVSVSLAAELIKKGHEVVFVSCRKSPYGAPYELPAPQKMLPSSADYAEENVREMLALLRDEHVDVILNQNAHSEPYNRMIAEVREQSGVPVVSALHFDPINRITSNRHLIDFRFNTIRENVVGALRMIATTWPFTIVTMHSQKRMLRNLRDRSDAVVLLSETFKPAFFRLAGGKDPEKIFAINNMLSWPMPEEPTGEKEKTILFVGRLNHSQKRPEQLLTAWSRIEKRLPDWRVVIVGDGPMRADLEKYARELDLQRVSFEGFRDPRAYYKQASVYVMTSSHEGWPLTIMEAKQYGCVPVVYKSFVSVTDQVSDGENGCLVDPFNQEEMARKIVALAEDDALRNEMSRKARQSCARFAPGIIAAQWEDVLSSVIRKNGKEKE